MQVILPSRQLQQAALRLQRTQVPHVALKNQSAFVWLAPTPTCSEVQTARSNQVRNIETEKRGRNCNNTKIRHKTTGKQVYTNYKNRTQPKFRNWHTIRERACSIFTKTIIRACADISRIACALKMHVNFNYCLGLLFCVLFRTIPNCRVCE